MRGVPLLLLGLGGALAPAALTVPSTLAGQSRASKLVDAAFASLGNHNLDSAETLLRPVLDSTVKATTSERAAALVLHGVIDFLSRAGLRGRERLSGRAHAQPRAQGRVVDARRLPARGHLAARAQSHVVWIAVARLPSSRTRRGLDRPNRETERPQGAVAGVSPGSSAGWPDGPRATHRRHRHERPRGARFDQDHR